MRWRGLNSEAEDVVPAPSQALIEALQKSELMRWSICGSLTTTIPRSNARYIVAGN